MSSLFGGSTFGGTPFGGEEMSAPASSPLLRGLGTDPHLLTRGLASPPPASPSSLTSTLIGRGWGGNPRLLTRGFEAATPPPLTPALVTRGMGSPARMLTRGLRPLLPAPSGSGAGRRPQTFGSSRILARPSFGPGRLG